MSCRASSAIQKWVKNEDELTSFEIEDEKNYSGIGFSGNIHDLECLTGQQSTTAAGVYDTLLKKAGSAKEVKAMIGGNGLLITFVFNIALAKQEY